MGTAAEACKLRDCLMAAVHAKPPTERLRIQARTLAAAAHKTHCAHTKAHTTARRHLARLARVAHIGQARHPKNAGRTGGLTSSLARP